MPKGIIIMGPAAAGKSTLGKAVAKKLNYPYFDIDDFLWRKDTKQPYTVMYSRQEKIDGLRKAISNDEHFVMAGSMSSFHEEFDPCFEMIVFLKADTKIRVDRANNRALERYGERVLPGGDMYENHQEFIKYISAYEDEKTSPNIFDHTAWFNSLNCIKLELDGTDDIDKNCNKIVEIYLKEEHD